jgi:hypothetical protein
MNSICPEDRFMLDCLRSFLQPDELPAIDPDLDWDRLLSSAGRHRVVPLLYLALKRGSTHPPNIVAEEFDKNAIRSLELSAELKRVLGLLDVPAMPFKGPTLAALAYGSASYRQFDDIDLMINASDYYAVKKALLENGYRVAGNLRPDRERDVLKSLHHWPFYNPANRILLEVHWQVAPKIYSFPLKVSDLFRRAVSVRLFGQDLLALSPQDAILILSEHGTRHYWGRLSWICDIAKLCNLEPDWNSILDTAGRLGIRRATLLAISLARNILGSDLPDGLSPDADRAVLQLAREAEDRLFSEFSPTDPRTEIFYIRARERSCDKLRYYLYRAIIPTEDDWATVDLPRDISSLYYLVRPVRLLRNYGLNVAEWLV